MRSAPPDLLASTRPNRSSLRAEPVRSEPRRVVHLSLHDSGAVLGAARHLPDVAESRSSSIHQAAPPPRCRAFSASERRRSRTYPAWGYQTSPVLKINRAGLAYRSTTQE